MVADLPCGHAPNPKKSTQEVAAKTKKQAFIGVLCINGSRKVNMTSEYSAGVIVARSDWVPRIPIRQFLILRVYARWDFPKGKVEWGETPFEAAKRELKEESGLKAKELEWPVGEDYFDAIYTLNRNTKKTVRLFFAMAPRRSPGIEGLPVYLSKEHHGFQWADYLTAKRLLPDRFQEALEWAVSNFDKMKE